MASDFFLSKRMELPLKLCDTDSSGEKAFFPQVHKFCFSRVLLKVEEISPQLITFSLAPSKRLSKVEPLCDNEAI